MMTRIAEDLAGDQEAALVAEVKVVAQTVAVQIIAVALQMGEAEIVQTVDHLQTIQGSEEAILQADGVALHPKEAAALQVMEDVAAKKVLLQADEICIKL